jgi:hypothetical protein
MNRRPFLIGFLCGCAALSAIFLLSSDVAAQYELCETTKAGTKECAPYSVIRYAHEVGAALNTYNGVLTAVATILIAYFTFSLRLATDRLWQAGERQLDYLRESSERQLRAYVHVEEAPIRFSNDVFTVEFRIKNFGQTPAHSVWVNYAFEAVPCKDKEPVRIPVPDDNYSLGSIAPLTDFYQLDAEVRDVSLPSVADGDCAIYLVGTITYVTVFNRTRQTNFRYLVGGEIGWEDESEMSADDNGNDAT